MELKNLNIMLQNSHKPMILSEERERWRLMTKRRPDARAENIQLLSKLIAIMLEIEKLRLQLMQKEVTVKVMTSTVVATEKKV